MTTDALTSIAESLAAIADSLAAIAAQGLMTSQMQRIDARPGDVFVISCERMLSNAQRQSLADLWEKFMPDSKLMVLDGGLSLGVIGKDRGDETDGEPATYLDGRSANPGR